MDGRLEHALQLQSSPNEQRFPANLTSPSFGATQVEQRSSSILQHTSSATDGFQTRTVCLDFPRFDGDPESGVAVDPPAKPPPGSTMQVLVDSGSTHNFVQNRVAKYLGLAVELAKPLSVLVENGTTLQREGVIKNLIVKFPDHSATIEAVVLPLIRADLVFGVQWLSKLGPLMFDFEKRTLEFVDGERRVQLTSEPTSVPTPLSLNRIR
ncbi:hypothetical protein NE237_026625 [Protea cynaroides]|uniref:Uncharacterized protein n=1 Tax=Protea cynaroides TaxID=273540 RepID=A0A9Q0H9A8_9MAGN|nr:hypothetical protein NE237_026625 [Protea cynaroides]